jgi:hypothetical protein
MIHVRTYSAMLYQFYWSFGIKQQTGGGRQTANTAAAGTTKFNILAPELSFKF